MEKSTYIFNYQTEYQKAISDIQRSHESGADSLATSRSLTIATDRLIKNIFDLLDTSLQEPVIVLAPGGYGRCELSPHSDIDLLILHKDSLSEKKAEHTAMALLHLLYDVGLRIGHALRNFEEMFQLHSNDYDSWAAFLESRFICGNETLYNELVTNLESFQKENKNLDFIRYILEQTHLRHQKYGNSIKLLEPNIKYSAGGLRDIHIVLWMSQYLNPNPLGSPKEKDSYRSTCINLINTFTKQKLIDFSDKHKLTDAFSFLLRTRHQLHLHAGSLHDTLDFSIQEVIAQKLGYQDTQSKRAVEHFMHDYYINAKEIKNFNEMLSYHFAELALPSRQDMHTIVQLDEHLILSGDSIRHRGEMEEQNFESLHILRSFIHQAHHKMPFDNKLKNVIRKRADVFDKNIQSSPDAGKLFRELLRSPYPAYALRSMHDLGILERLIPEYSDFIAFYQHSQYHYYSADEHTLVALEKLDELKEDKTLLGEIYRSLDKVETLYFALLLHDIAKPRRLTDHEIIGADLAEEILARLGQTDIANDVAFLIRNHLMMEQIAFRRNIYEDVTINEFASLFNKPEQLDMLYLLTYADLSAVNPKVWTAWKNQLLQELYIRTASVLDRQKDDLAQLEKYRGSVEKLVGKISKHAPEDSIRNHIDQFDDQSYITSFSDDEIRKHIELIQKNHLNQNVITVHLSRHHAFTEITVIAKDRPYALSDFCGILTVHDVNIIDANIFTRADGIIIDKFRVVDVVTEKALSDESCAAIIKHFKELENAERIDFDLLIERQRKKWKRRYARKSAKLDSIQIGFDETPHHTIIDVFGPDTTGMLYRITRVLSDLGLNIYFAKIATRGDGIVDSFYVLTRKGNKVSPEQYEEIKEKIKSSLQPLLSLDV